MMTVSKVNLFLVGPMGAGKTSVGRYLARQLNLAFYDSDEEIEKRTGARLAWIYDIEGEEGLRDREAKVIDDLTCLNNIVLATGGGCVETPLVRDILRQRGTVVQLHVSLENQIARLRNDKKRPMLQQEGESREDVLIKLFEERESHYEKISDFSVKTDGRSVKEVCDDILMWLGTKK